MGYSPVNRNNTGITAIVIDDDMDTVSVLSDFLQLKGITVLGKGYGGLEAVKIYENLRPDVVFLDVMMKKHDGFYTLQKIREIQSDAIIILITADMTEETRIKLLEMKASAIIYKPYDINEIVDVVNKLVLKLKQELLEDIAHKKAILCELNYILKKRLERSNTTNQSQFFNEKEKLV
ncbi:MAG TPA: response regulator [Candidatus Nitrosotalea sp.]|nr:response regulator [Candidatus Nitrosotalea sp.]